MSMIRSRWAAVGAAVAITLGAGGVSLTQAAISSGEKPVYVSLDAPCRVVDTRSSVKIGAGDDDALDVQITGENGDCTGPLAIPADAVGVSTNVTVIQPSDSASGRSYFTVYPTGETRPVTSNLNFVNGQAPTPNKVDVGIGAGGKITIYNNEGSAHAAVDIFGYYIDHNHDDRYYQKGEVDTALGAKANAADVYTKSEIDAASLWAVVNSDATLARGSNVTSTGDVGFGYEVIFNRNVADCAYVASVGSTTGGNPPAGFVAVARRDANPNGVFISIFDADGNNVDQPFHVMVQC